MPAAGRCNAGFSIGRRIFATVLGAILFCAFLSLLIQAKGLFGAHGIVPVAEYLQRAQTVLGPEAIWHVPTFSWISQSDAMLVGQCITGALAAALLAFGFLPGPCALICWALYLSLCAVGSPFLDFQWDALLLETSLLAAFALPWRVRALWAHQTPVACMARLLLVWLLFRLNFESGVVKLSSGDPTWRAGTALTYHFETQPLPLWTAWLAHQAPAALLKVSTWTMFVIELVVPWFLFGPRLCRLAAATALIGLQAAILLTGNYAYFNWLTIALALLTIDDRFFRSLAPRFFAASSGPGSMESTRARAICFGAFAVFYLVTTSSGLIGTFRAGLPLRDLHAAIAPLRSFNSYGLFAVMTTTRPEIIIEGSADGHVWVPYEFKWKPGDVRARPKLVAPHQPRLDWQLWFAALGSIRENPWFASFLMRLLEGRPEVTSLLGPVPFSPEPPRYVRAVLYEYRFTHFGDHTAAWWKRERLGLYCPPVTWNDDHTMLQISP